MIEKIINIHFTETTLNKTLIFLKFNILQNHQISISRHTNNTKRKKQRRDSETEEGR